MSAVSASDPPSHPLLEKIALLVDEARWLLVGLSGHYLTIILGGFDRGDPGWSQAAIVERIANPGGRFGAWLSDLCFTCSVFRLGGGSPCHYSWWRGVTIAWATFLVENAVPS